MSIEFVKISGGKFDFIKDKEVKDQIDEAGRKEIILVEGKTDKRIFNILFDDVLEDKVAYIPTGTHSKVKEYLKTILNREIKGFLGITDRDFITDEERERSIAEFKKKLYIHKRYAIENYLIEGELLLELIKNVNMEAEISLDEINEIILKVLNDLISVMAGNITLYKYSANYLEKSSPYEKDIVLRKVLDNIKRKVINENGYQIDKWIVESLYNENLDKLMKVRDNIYELHKIVNGKYFFHNFNHEIKKLYEIRGLRCDDNDKCTLAWIAKSKGISIEIIDIRNFIQNSIENN